MLINPNPVDIVAAGLVAITVVGMVDGLITLIDRKLQPKVDENE